jgi:ketosteroid isomerase-like protein
VTGPEVVRRYLDALNRRDLPAMLQLLHPEVEFVTGRGLRHGHDEVRKWLGEPYAELEVERAVDRVQVAGPIRYRWRDSGEVADETGFAWLFEVHEDRITRWQKFDEEAAALAAAGLPTKTTS